MRKRSASDFSDAGEIIMGVQLIDMKDNTDKQMGRHISDSNNNEIENENENDNDSL